MENKTKILPGRVSNVKRFQVAVGFFGSGLLLDVDRLLFSTRLVGVLLQYLWGDPYSIMGASRSNICLNYFFELIEQSNISLHALFTKFILYIRSFIINFPLEFRTAKSRKKKLNTYTHKTRDSRGILYVVLRCGTQYLGAFRLFRWKYLHWSRVQRLVISLNIYVARYSLPRHALKLCT